MPYLGLGVVALDSQSKELLIAGSQRSRHCLVDGWDLWLLGSVDDVKEAIEKRVFEMLDVG
jgi:hypothetical protein